MTPARTTEDVLQEILKELQNMNGRLYVLETQATERQELCRLHEKQLVQHDKRLSGLEQAEARVESLPKRVDDLTEDVYDIRDALSSLKGSWKTWLAVVSAVSGFFGGIIGALMRKGGG
jgi:chromosome segregation ATPase